MFRIIKLVTVFIVATVWVRPVYMVTQSPSLGEKLRENIKLKIF